jgi:hypothetical protein
LFSGSFRPEADNARGAAGIGSALLADEWRGAGEVSKGQPVRNGSHIRVCLSPGVGSVTADKVMADEML